ncbi:MAG: hypothetical protein K2Q01_07175, partial [Rickettsiales bacterium]|nr:hypothetical protein [Rickettsiales bacterium]
GDRTNRDDVAGSLMLEDGKLGQITAIQKRITDTANVVLALSADAYNIAETSAKLNRLAGPTSKSSGEYARTQAKLGEAAFSAATRQMWKEVSNSARDLAPISAQPGVADAIERLNAAAQLCIQAEKERSTRKEGK